MDVEEAHRGLASGPDLFSEKPRSQPTWRVMADVMLHFEQRRFASAEERASARKAYRVKRLGRRDGDSLLMELLPYPNQNASEWLYTSRFPTRAIYVAKMLSHRIPLLTDVLSQCDRRAIICYGRHDWNDFRRLFAEVAWKTARRFESAVWNNARVTLADHFSTKYFNTDEQLDELSAVALP
jgi:hypothetical protein